MTVRRTLAILSIALLLGCWSYRGALVYLDPDGSSRDRLSDADVERAKRLCAEVAARYEIPPGDIAGLERSAAHPGWTLIAMHTGAEVRPGIRHPSEDISILVVVADDRSQLYVSLTDYGTPGGSERYHEIQAELERRFEAAFATDRVRVVERDLGPFGP